MKKYIGGLAVACALLGVSAFSCSDKATEPFKDAPRSGLNGDPALVIEMPDGFSNLATKCINGVRYTVAFHGDKPYAGVSVVGGANSGC